MVTDFGPQPPPPGDPQPDDEQPPEGGETACWAHLVCPECGAMTTEGHRPSCAMAPRASG